jgi:hypothetical protein
MFELKPRSGWGVNRYSQSLYKIYILNLSIYLYVYIYIYILYYIYIYIYVCVYVYYTTRPYNNMMCVDIIKLVEQDVMDERKTICRVLVKLSLLYT